MDANERLPSANDVSWKIDVVKGETVVQCWEQPSDPHSQPRLVPHTWLEVALEPVYYVADCLLDFDDGPEEEKIVRRAVSDGIVFRMTKGENQIGDIFVELQTCTSEEDFVCILRKEWRRKGFPDFRSVLLRSLGGNSPTLQSFFTSVKNRLEARRREMLKVDLQVVQRVGRQEASHGGSEIFVLDDVSCLREEKGKMNRQSLHTCGLFWHPRLDSTLRPFMISFPDGDAPLPNLLQSFDYLVGKYPSTKFQKDLKMVVFQHIGFALSFLFRDIALKLLGEFMPINVLCGFSGSGKTVTAKIISFLTGEASYRTARISEADRAAIVRFIRLNDRPIILDDLDKIECLSAVFRDIANAMPFRSDGRTFLMYGPALAFMNQESQQKLMKNADFALMARLIFWKLNVPVDGPDKRKFIASLLETAKSARWLLESFYNLTKELDFIDRMAQLMERFVSDIDARHKSSCPVSVAPIFPRLLEGYGYSLAVTYAVLQMSNDVADPLALDEEKITEVLQFFGEQWSDVQHWYAGRGAELLAREKGQPVSGTGGSSETPPSKDNLKRLFEMMGKVVSLKKTDKWGAYFGWHFGHHRRGPFLAVARSAFRVVFATPEVNPTNLQWEDLRQLTTIEGFPNTVKVQSVKLRPLPSGARESYCWTVDLAACDADDVKTVRRAFAKTHKADYDQMEMKMSGKLPKKFSIPARYRIEADGRNYLDPAEEAGEVEDEILLQKVSKVVDDPANSSKSIKNSRKRKTDGDEDEVPVEEVATVFGGKRGRLEKKIDEEALSVSPDRGSTERNARPPPSAVFGTGRKSKEGPKTVVCLKRVGCHVETTSPKKLRSNESARVSEMCYEEVGLSEHSVSKAAGGSMRTTRSNIRKRKNDQDGSTESSIAALVPKRTKKQSNSKVENLEAQLRKAKTHAPAKSTGKPGKRTQLTFRELPEYNFSDSLLDHDLKIPKLDGWPDPEASSEAIRSEISSLALEIKNELSDQRSTQPSTELLDRMRKTLWPRKRPDVFRESKATALEVAQVFGVHIEDIPELSCAEVQSLAEKLFGAEHPTIEVLRQQEVDGQGLMLLDVEGFLKYLKLPIGAAVTLDSLVKLTRESRNLPPPKLL